MRIRVLDTENCNLIEEFPYVDISDHLEFDYEDYYLPCVLSFIKYDQITDSKLVVYVLLDSVSTADSIMDQLLAQGYADLTKYPAIYDSEELEDLDCDDEAYQKVINLIHFVQASAKIKKKEQPTQTSVTAEPITEKKEEEKPKESPIAEMKSSLDTFWESLKNN